MLQLLMLLGFAYAQDSYGQAYPAYVWAIIFGVASSLLSLVTGSPFLAVVIGGVMLTLYAWGYFAILRRFSDNTILWLMICIGGLIFPFLLPMLFMS